jgi:hypothetical protein
MAVRLVVSVDQFQRFGFVAGAQTVCWPVAAAWEL